MTTRRVATTARWFAAKCRNDDAGRRYARCVRAAAAASKAVVEDDADSVSFDIISASPTVAASYAERGDHRVLLVGEGDFSFTLALLRACDASGVAMSTTATSYDAREDVARRYRGEANLTALSRDYGDHVRVLHGVDATDLTTAIGSSEKFDRVVFNFPHIAGKAKMDRNRALLGGYLKSAQDVLSERGLIEVALAPGQGGTAMDGDERREYGNSWQCYTQGAENGCLLVGATRFDEDGWRALGYESRGHWRSLGAERGFRTKNGVVHAFVPEGNLPPGAACTHCMPFTRDVSVWVDEPTEDAASTVRDAFARALEGADVQISRVDLIDAWRDEREGGRLSETYRVELVSRTVGLTRDRVNAWNHSARLALGGRLRGALTLDS
jgi:25S rRNA (uracil2634-N3)-methyltransferase